MPFFHDRVAMKRLFAGWLLIIGYVNLIFFIQPLPDLPWPLSSIFTGNDSINWGLHLVGYGLFAVLIYSVLSIQMQRSGLRPPFDLRTLTVLIILVLSILDELHQIRRPARTPSLDDISTNLLGALLALKLVSLLQGWYQSRQQRKRQVGKAAVPADSNSVEPSP